jgi:hypothetical protein
MRLDYIVSSIEASQDWSPYVFITYSNPSEFKAGADRGPSLNPFGATMMAFTPPKDALNAMMKLQSYGVTIEEILNIHEFMNSAR